MIAPNAKAAWDLMSVAKLVDGKYFLAGTQANSSNVFADIYSAGSSKFTSRQFQFDTGVNINLHKVLKGLSFETHSQLTMPPLIILLSMIAMLFISQHGLTLMARI